MATKPIKIRLFMFLLLSIQSMICNQEFNSCNNYIGIFPENITLISIKICIKVIHVRYDQLMPKDTTKRKVAEDI